MKTCLIDAAEFIEEDHLLDPLRGLGEISLYKGIPNNVEEVVARAGDAGIVVFAMMQFTNEMLKKLPHLKILQFMGTGVWNFVDPEFSKERGITVLNIEDYGSNAVAEFALAQGFALARHLAQADALLKKKQWSAQGLKGLEIKGCTYGVVGTGNIGALVAQKASLLGANVIASDLFPKQSLTAEYGVKYTSLEELFATSDIISLHMKTTPENKGIINDALFKLMKRDSFLINAARAELVNGQDLYNALTDSVFAAAAIDVYYNEPPTEFDYQLAALDNVLASPHIGFYTQEANRNSVIFSVNSIVNELKKVSNKTYEKRLV